MTAAIYYFSGTGNSLVVARSIADQIGGEVMPIASLVSKECIETDSDVIGLVFPVYNQGVPYIVKRFIDRLMDLEKKYIFAVCTSGSGPYLSLEYLDRMVRSKNGKLAAGFAIRMPYNYVSPVFAVKDFLKKFTFREISPEEQNKLYSDCESKLERICQFVDGRSEGVIETSSAPMEHLIDFLNLRETLQKTVWLKIAGFEGTTTLSFQESMQLMDYGFYSDEKCSSCGICSRVCPVGNIKLDEGKPIWQHRCEQCFACFHWCPKTAIQFGCNTAGRKRYHHPYVDLSDMLE